MRETDDTYPFVVAVLSDKWRVIECKDDMQWILQRAEGKGPQPRWRNERFCRTREGLKSSLGAFSIDAGQLLDRLPARYVEGQHVAQPESLAA